MGKIAIQRYCVQGNRAGPNFEWVGKFSVWRRGWEGGGLGVGEEKSKLLSAIHYILNVVLTFIKTLVTAQ